MLVEDGIIRYIGNSTEAKKRAGNITHTTHLNGKMVMAGIQDVHMHPLEAESDFAGTCLYEQ